MKRIHVIPPTLGIGDRSLRVRLLLALASMLVPLVAVGVTGSAFLKRSSSAFRHVTEQVAAESAVQDRLRILLGREHGVARAYVTRRDVKARAEFRSIAAEIDTGFARLGRLYAERHASVGSPWADWKQADANAERAFASKVLPADDPTARYPLIPFHRLAGEAATSLGEQQAAGYERIQAEAVEAGRARQTALLLFLGVFLLSIGVAATVARVLGRAILRPLERLEAAAKRLGDDDLSARVEVERNDEIGRVGEAFNMMSRRLAESRDSRVQLEEQLRQAQKMEAIGRLAGGVAHDFNNLLTAISGHSELALHELARPASSDPRLEQHDRTLARHVDEIRRAAERAASLTGQLLAFSRRQILRPEILDPNRLVAEMSAMLKRLIGEDIALTAMLAPDLARLEADSSQIEQILMNLAVNARDAMPAGGKLTIETANVLLDEDYANRHEGVVPGPHVMIAVSDTGHGIDAQTLERIFEPFYTTKEVGKGTGLGLATVYGIVKQSGGSIYVYSEPGQGTTFKIYLPSTDRTSDETPAGARARAAGGDETILLVEDADAVRELAVEMLELHGYRVLAANEGEAALAIAADHASQIDLLITDVVMPGLTGPDLASYLAAETPQLKVMYTSGYTGEAIVRHGVLEHGVEFLQKPFTLNELGHKVREVLDRPAPALRKAS